MPVVQKKVQAFRGNVRAGMVMAVEGLNRCLRYDASLNPGSGLPKIFQSEMLTYTPSGLRDAIVAAASQTYPPAVFPA